MKVSLVMAVYNGEKYLIEQLDSIRKQTYPIDEVILIDDVSTDNSYELIHQYIDGYKLINWKLIKNENNLGYRKNFKKGLEIVDGDIIFLSDQDDLILLDIQLPDGNGISLCKEIKEKYEVPIIFLSCLSDEETIVRGLNEGGDDYVCKPFGIKELCARIECNLRKVTKQQGVYYIDDLIIDTLKHKVFKDNKELELSTITFALLVALVEGHGRVLTRDYLLMLIEDITGHVVEDNTLTAHLKRLRKTLGEYQNRKYIETLRGVGYRWKI